MTPLLLLLLAEPMTLERAIELALENNEAAAIAEARQARAEAEKRAAIAMLFPTAEILASYRRRGRVATITRDDGTEVNITRRNALNGELALGMTVFDATSIPNIRAADERVDAQRKWTEEEKRQLAFSVADTFLSLLTAERTLQVAKRREQLARQVVADVTARFDAGLTKKSDVNRASLEQATAELEQTRADNAVRRLRIALFVVIGQEVEVVAPFTVQVTEALDALLEEATERPDLIALRAEARAAERRAEEPWMRMIPSLDVGASLRLTNETGFVGEPFNWDVTLGLNWLLYDGRRYADAAAAGADRSIAALELARRSRTVVGEVRTAAAEVDTSVAAVVQAERRLGFARENAEEVRTRYGRGLASALEQADAAANEFEAGLELERQRFLLERARLLLRRSVGRWPL